MSREFNNDSSSSAGVRRLISGEYVVKNKVPVSYRHWLRMCDAGLAPWGVKCGARRLWDEGEIDCWIASGCKPVRPVRTGDAR
jgi:hypothetical protein